MSEKLPPQNLEAEVAVLGSMLIEEDALAQAIEVLTPQSFYKEAHRKIFQGMLALFNEHKAADLITLTDVLTREGTLEAAGGATYLAYLTSAVPTAAVPAANARGNSTADVDSIGAAQLTTRRPRNPPTEMIM